MPDEPQSTETEGPAPRPPWTRARLELHGWLQRTAPSLARLYKGAVQLMFETQVEGRERFIRHAVREIRNRLPDAINGDRREQVKYRKVVNELAEAWKRSGLPIDGHAQVSIGSSSSADQPPTTLGVPEILYVQAPVRLPARQSSPRFRRWSTPRPAASRSTSRTSGSRSRRSSTSRTTSATRRSRRSTTCCSGSRVLSGYRFHVGPGLAGRSAGDS
jgi:hypothetical protein